jgi:hypothetical protein
VASPDKKAFLLRLPHAVWAQIERLAAAELRSVNGQIEYLLRESLARRTGSGGEPAAASGQSGPSAGSAGSDPDERTGRHKNKR